VRLSNKFDETFVDRLSEVGSSCESIREGGIQLEAPKATVPELLLAETPLVQFHETHPESFATEF
jgi:hypothetical protein